MGRDEFAKISTDELRQMLPIAPPTIADVRWNVGNVDEQRNLNEIPDSNIAADVLDKKDIDPGLALWNEDYSHRPSWCDAKLAWKQVKNKKAKGCQISLRFRGFLQTALFKLGCCIQGHYRQVLFVGVLALFLFCVFGFGFRNLPIETDIDKLWVQKDGRLADERQFMRHLPTTIGDGQSSDHGGGSGSSTSATSTAQYLVLIQTPRTKGSGDILTVEDLLLHVKVLQNISQMVVEMHGENWTLPDICFKPEPPTIEGDMAAVFQSFVDKIIPCIMITPLDCFWEGSKALGPFPPATVPDFVTLFVPSLSKEISWKSLDPARVVDELLEVLQLKDLETIKSLFVRAGVDNGYIKRPCIDPLDPECPTTAPNHVDICPVVEKFLKWNDEQGDRYKLRMNATTTTTKPPPIVEDTKLEEFFTDDDENKTNPVKILNFRGVVGVGSSSSVDDEPFDNEECQRYKNEIRRLLRSDEDLLSKFLPQVLAKNRRFGKDVTGGCSGFAQKFMQWPEDLIIGGVERESNRIVKADALQTVLMITSASEVYQRGKNSDKKKLNRYEWTVEAADKVLTAWQRNFTSFVYNYPNNTNNRDGVGLRHLHPLAGTSINDMMGQFSQFNPTVILVGYAFMILYAAASLLSCTEYGVRSSVGLAVSGCLLVTLAGLAGLGFSMILGIPFNAATTQIVPFLALGLGVDDMFLLVHSYRAILKYCRRDEMGMLLKETGLSALLTSLNNIIAFGCGSILPVPALRDFCLQVTILLCFNAVSILTLFPAIITIDLYRRREKRVDIFCCITCRPKDKVQPKDEAAFDGVGVIVDDSPPLYDRLPKNSSSQTSVSSANNVAGCFAKSPSKHKIFHNYNDQSDRSGCRARLDRKCGLQHFTLHRFVKDYYVKALAKTPVKVLVIIANLFLLGIGAVGCSRVSLGLELTDVIPKDTAPYAFLDARENYFSFYPFNAVLRGPLDVAKKQILIRQYREALARVPYVVKSDMGDLTEQFWLQLLGEWLSNLQVKFDHDWEYKLIDRNGVVPNKTASIEAILAYKLLCNKGDEVQRSRVGNTRLVDKDGNINPDGFYNYLTAWYYLDPMTYYVSQANIYPTPPTWRNEDKLDAETDIKIPPAPMPVYSQIPFFLNNLVDTPATVDMIKKVRAICDDYRARGLETFPDGLPFTFWEQYIDLQFNLFRALAVVIGAVVVVVGILLCSPWTAIIVGTILVVLVVELGGFMGIVGLKLNAVSGVTLITAVGIGVEFTVHVSLSYLTALGSRDQRMARTLEHMFIPVLHGGLSTLLGVLMLAFSEFDFVFRYFFMVMTALVILGLINGLIFLPVVLSLLGPRSEVSTIDGSPYLLPPTPLPPPRKVIDPHASQQKPEPTLLGPDQRRLSESLSTINEEEGSPPHSATPPMVTVAPMHVTVHAGGAGRRNVDAPVTVTAKAKVNVQVQLGNTVLDQYSFRRTTTTERAPPSAMAPGGTSTTKEVVEPANRKRHRSASCQSPQSVVDADGGIYFAAKSSCASSADSVAQDEVAISTPKGSKRKTAEATNVCRM